MEGHEIKPEWRTGGDSVRSRHRPLSLPALGLSVAVHAAIVALAVGWLVRATAARSVHESYLIAHIVDRLPGEGGQRAHGDPNTVKLPVTAGSPPSNAVHSRVKTPAKLRSWIDRRPEGLRERERRAIQDTAAFAAAKDVPLSEPPSGPAPAGAAKSAADAKPPDKAPEAEGNGPAPEAAITSGGDGAPVIASATGNRTGASIGYSSQARAAYGETPPPDYPEPARRMEQQGTVLLRVLVAADGAVRRVEVGKSSGFDILDRAALETVRARWRFVPARRRAAAVESWVLVPIRFSLTEAQAAE